MTTADRRVVRDLARRVAEIAELPEMRERIDLWRRHNDLERVRPLILVFPEGAWGELLPESTLSCEDPGARGIEAELRRRIYTYERFASDNVVTAEWIVGKVIHSSGWGLTAQHRPSTAARGAWAFDPVILSPADLAKLRFPEIQYDEEATQRHLAFAHDLFGDILDVQLRGVCHVSFHLMNLYTGWRGLQQVMADMVMEPQMLHDAMAFLEEGHHRLVRQYVEQNLLSLNNDNTYHSSGGNGYTSQLPAPGFDPERVRPCDMWASAESQEMAGISPEHHEEFALQYERRLLEPFGLTGYGCCEPLHDRLDRVFTLPRIRRISISPFADVERSAEQLGDRYIFSWKPQPSHLVGAFRPDLIRDYLARTVEIARDCVLEIILKDTHTCEGHPERFDEWTRIARSLVG